MTRLPHCCISLHCSELVALYNTIRSHWLAAATHASAGRPFEWHIRDPLWKQALAYTNVNIGRARVSRRPTAAEVATAAARSSNAPTTASSSTCPNPPSLLYDSRLPDSGVGPSCIYIRHTAASVPAMVSHHFLASLGLKDGGYNALHLRRTDKSSPSVCNTTIERVVEIAVTALPRAPRLLIFTDEKKDTACA